MAKNYKKSYKKTYKPYKKGIKKTKYMGKTFRKRANYRKSMKGGAFGKTMLYKIAKIAAKREIAKTEKTYITEVAPNPETYDTVNWSYGNLKDTPDTTNRTCVGAWFPNIKLDELTFTQGLLDLPNPKRVKILNFTNSMQITQENITNDLKWMKYYVIQPKKKLQDNVVEWNRFIDIFVKQGTAVERELLKATQIDSVGTYLNEMGFKMNVEDIFKTQFKDFFNIIKKGRWCKNFPREKWAQKYDLVSGTNSFTPLIEDKQFLNNKIEIDHKVTTQYNIIRPNTATATWWNSAANRDQFDNTTQYTFYYYIPVYSQFSEGNSTAGFLNNIVLKFKIDRLVGQYKVYNYSSSEMIANQAMAQMTNDEIALEQMMEQEQEYEPPLDENGVPLNPDYGLKIHPDYQMTKEQLVDFLLGRGFSFGGKELGPSRDDNPLSQVENTQPKYQLGGG